MADGLHHDGKVPNEVLINSLKAPVDLSGPKGPQIAGNSPTTVSCCRPISTPWTLPDHPSFFSQGGTCSKNFRELPLDIFYSQGSEGGASHLRSLIWNLRQFNISISSRSQNLFSGNFPLHPHWSFPGPRSCSKSLIWILFANMGGSPDCERCGWILNRPNGKEHTSNCFANFLGRKWVVGLIFIPCLPM